MADGLDFGIRIFADAKDALLNLDNVKTAIQAIVPSIGLLGFANDIIQTSEEIILFGSIIDQTKQKFSEFLPNFENLSNSSLKISTAFGESLGKVSTLSDEYFQFSEAAQQLSRDLKGQVSSTDLLSAGYETLSSGVVGVAANIELLRAAALGAKGGFTDIKTVADGATTVLNAYGKSADEAAKIVDIFIATQNAGKIVVGEYASLIGDAATIAAQAGVSFEELSAFVATATASGVKAGAAITGLRQAIAAILKPSSDAIALSKEIGVQFDAQALKSKGLAKILDEVYKSSANGVEFNQNLTRLFGSVEAVAAILPSAGIGASKFAANLDYATNSSGLAADAAQKVANTFQGEVSRGFILAQEAMVSFGKGVELVVRPLVQASNALLTTINSIAEPLKQAFGAVAAAGGIVLGAILSIIPALAIGYASQKAFAFISGIAGGAVTGLANSIRVASAQIALMELQLRGVNVGTAAFANTTGLAGLKLIALDTFITGFNATLSATPTIMGKIGVALKFALGVFVDFVKYVFVNVGMMIAKFALFAAAIDATTTAFGILGSMTFGSEAQKSIREADAELSKVRESIYGVKKASDEATFNIAAGMDRANSFTEKFVTSLVNAQAGLSKLFGGGEVKDAADEFGSDTSDIGQGFINITKNGLNAQGMLYGLATSFKFVTSAQREATDTQIELTEWLETLKAFNEITETIKKYGLTVVDAGDKSRLGAEGIKKFKDEIAKNIEVANKEIELLKSRTGLGKSAQAQVNAEISNLQRAISLGRLRISDLENQGKAIEGVANNTEDLAKSYESEIKALETSVNQKKILLQEQLASGIITADQLAVKVGAIEKDSYSNRLGIAAKFQQQLKAVRVGVTDKDELKSITEQEEKIEADSWKARESIAKLAIANREKIEKEAKDNLAKLEKTALDKFTETNKAAEVSLRMSQSERTQEVKQALLSRSINEEQAAIQFAQITQDSANKEILIIQDKITRINALELSSVEGVKTRNAEILKLQEDLAAANIRAIDTEIEAQKAVQQNQIKTIENKANVSQNAQERIILGLDSEVAALDRLTASYESQKNLQDVRASLAKVTSEAIIQGIDQQIQKLSTASEVKKDLDSTDINNIQLRQALEAELVQLGVNANTTELEFIKAKQAKENELAAQKRQALLKEQQLQQDALKLDILRNQAARERLTLEAQINELKAKQAQIEAQSGLQKAQVSKNAQEIANAQLMLELANQNVQLAGKQIEAVEKSNQVSKEVEGVQRQILDSTQKTALSAFDFSEKMRLSASKIDLAKTATDGLNKSLESTNSLAKQTGDNFAESANKMNRSFADTIKALQAPVGGNKLLYGFSDADPAANINKVIEATKKLLSLNYTNPFGGGGFNFDTLTGKAFQEQRVALEKAYGLALGSSTLAGTFARVGNIPTTNLNNLPQGGVGRSQLPSNVSNSVNQSNTIQIIDSPDPYGDLTKTLLAIGRI